MTGIPDTAYYVFTHQNDRLAKFIESRAIRWEKDRAYRQKLIRETAPTVAETLKRAKERKAA